MACVLHNLDDHQCVLATQLPNDLLFQAKNIPESTLYKLLEANAVSLQDVERNICEMIEQWDPTKTEDFLSEWESAVGIPDDCITVLSTPEDRRDMILLKLTALGVSTAADFIALASRIGFCIEIVPGADALAFPYTFPLIFVDSNMTARYTMIVKAELSKQPNVFPFIFPILFTDGEQTNILECLFRKLIPANVRVLFQYTLPDC